MIKWPEKHEDFLCWATALNELMGGRKDVCAYFPSTWSFPGKTPWLPLKDRRVKGDFLAPEGFCVRQYENKKTGLVENYLMSQLNAQVLVKHLTGNKRLGVYVVDLNSCVSFLAADFDDHKGTLDPGMVWGQVQAFVDICDTHDWVTFVERSKSGKGFHVWLFFDSPVAAGKARAVGKWLMEEAQIIDADTDFSTFDRFFPAQSRVDVDGTGNLIGIPCFGFKDFSEGRSCWVDGDNQIVDDPLNFTLTIFKTGRNAAGRVDEFMLDNNLEPEEVAVKSDRSSGDDSDELVLGSAEEFEAVKARCDFLQFASAREHQDKIDEPLWYAMISNACRFSVDDWIHEASMQHPGYSHAETKNKISQARKNTGPHPCSLIQEYGFKRCPDGGCALPGDNRVTKSPAGLVSWSRQPKKIKKYNRNVNVSAEGYESLAEEERDNIYGQFDPHPETGAPWPPLRAPWRMGEGVFDGGKDKLITLRPIWVAAKTMSVNREPGILVKFFDTGWQSKQYAFPARRLNESSSPLAVELTELQFPTIPGMEKWLYRYLAMHWADVKDECVSTSRLGWISTDDSKAAFVLPAQIVGEASKPIVYQPDNAGAMLISAALSSRGKLGDWQKHVAGAALDNPFLMFSVMMGLAGPLVWFTDVECAGFHFYGTTSRGKTTMAQCAASVWGNGEDPQTARGQTAIRSWNSTGAALEGTAELFNHICLCLDEIGEVDPFELGKIIYQLSGGISKGRGMAQGGIRAFKQWRLLFLSTGERSVRQIIAATGQTMKGGQRARLPDICVDKADGASDVVWNTKGAEAEVFVRRLKVSCGKFCGTAGPAFVGMLIQRGAELSIPKLSGELKKELAVIEEKLKEGLDELPSEMNRVVRRFAVIALAGMKSVEFGILPDWEMFDAFEAVQYVMSRWLAEIGEERNEVDRACALLRDNLISNMSRLHKIESTAVPHAAKLLGFVADDHFCLTPSGLRELCAEFDPAPVLHKLKHDSLLWHDAGKLTKKSPRIEALGNTRPYLYWISKEFLGEKDDGFFED